MVEWLIKEHPTFFKDLDKLGEKEIEIFYKKKEKIKQNPLRQKHLSGGANCYREPVTSNVRLIYFIEGEIIWLLAIGKHDAAYDKHIQMLFSLKTLLQGM